jgi:serine-aspartate repeat-containing protein C/D/E
MDINSYNINRFDGDVFENVLGGFAKRDIQDSDYNDSDYYSNSDSSSIKSGGAHKYVNIFESDDEDSIYGATADDNIEISEYMITSDDNKSDNNDDNKSDNNNDIIGGAEISEYMIMSDGELPDMDNDVSEYYEINDNNDTNDVHETDENKETDEVDNTNDNSDNNNETDGGNNNINSDNTEHIFLNDFKKMIENL